MGSAAAPFLIGGLLACLGYGGSGLLAIGAIGGRWYLIIGGALSWAVAATIYVVTTSGG